MSAILSHVHSPIIALLESLLDPEDPSSSTLLQLFFSSTDFFSVLMSAYHVKITPKVLFKAVFFCVSLEREVWFLQ